MANTFSFGCVGGPNRKRMGSPCTLGTPSLYSINDVKMLNASFAETRHARREDCICTKSASNPLNDEAVSALY